MRKNFDEFIVEISSWEKLPEIIIFTEIWIGRDESDFYQIANYDLNVHSNENYRSGGVAVYSKQNFFNSFDCEKIKFQTADILKTRFKIYKNEYVLLAVYRLHEYSITNFISEFSRYLFSSCTKADSKNLLIIGDMNVDLFKLDNEIDSYKALMASCGLESLIHETTRKTDQTQTCIDHVFARIECKDMTSIEAIVIKRQITDHYKTAVRLCCGWAGER